MEKKTNNQYDIFKIDSYSFDNETYIAKFNYQHQNSHDNSSLSYCETIKFAKPETGTFPNEKEVLDRALKLLAIVVGTSYYKTYPTQIINTNFPLYDFQAELLNATYQEGLSQFAYENGLSRADLGFHHGDIAAGKPKLSPLSFSGHGVLALQSGGKDSILTATLLNEKNVPWTALYISGNNGSYPKVLDELGAKNVQIVNRIIDREKLLYAAKNRGLNGHVPVTYINLAIALVQAILNGDNTILSSIGHEGAEAHATIESPDFSDLPDLPVNHQWSKTWEAEQLFVKNVTRFISADFNIGSPLRQFSELKIAKLFTEKCWEKYGHSFSSCNQANYKQGNDNSELKWCGECAKCANSYLLFSPFLPATELNSLFPAQKSLFEKPELTADFKGLLGINDAMKPFECVGETAELRKAYQLKGPDYPDLPFAVPESDFDYEIHYPSAEFSL